MLNGADYFHWITTRLLFASKRARLDLQVAVAYLCKRVKSPTILDYQKLTTSVVLKIYTWLSPSIYLYYGEKRYSLSVKFLHILMFRISEYYNTMYYCVEDTYIQGHKRLRAYYDFSALWQRYQKGSVKLKIQPFWPIGSKATNWLYIDPNYYLSLLKHIKEPHVPIFCL